MPRLAVIFVLFTWLASGQTPAPRLRTPSVLPISSVAVSGNKAISTDAILTTTGLKVKDEGSSAIFDAARDRLLATGYFDVVSYSFRQQDLGFAVTFNVGEVKQLYPLFVEALPISANELNAVIRAHDPLFNGFLPGSKAVIDRAAGWVEQKLADANPGLRVRAKVVPTGGDHYEVQFAPAEGLPVIADVAFEGTSAIKASDLHEAMVINGIGQFYSTANVHALLDRYILPMYEKLGYMRATFTEITSKPAATVKGLDVQVTVVEGPRFKPGAISIRGPMVNDSRRILRMANVANGEFADGQAIEAGAIKIHDTLRGEGYLDVAVTTGHVIHDAEKTVDSWYDVEPGEQYKFGRLEVLGLGLDGEAAIRKMWSVKPGDPFPGGYPDHFVEAVKQEGLFDNLGGITATPSVNKATHTVDVSLMFATAPATGPRRGSSN